MIRRDMYEVLAIENASFDFPWSERDFMDCLKQRSNVGISVESGGFVVGFMIYELHKTRLEIVNLAVLPELRRCDVGRAMIEKLVGKLSAERRRRLVLQIRESNLSGQQFFRELGFRASKILPRFYGNGEHIEDAYEMTYSLSGVREVWPVCRSRNRISKYLVK